MDSSLEAGEQRSSIEKPPLRLQADAFHRLPDEIIEHILLATNANGFASLALLNLKWRAASQRPHLYAHHLAGCSSHASSTAIIPPADAENLPLLRALFARQAKRNLFQVYLRPRTTLVKLESNSISSSSCPGGEGMQFTFSPTGRHVLAYNSSRIYLIAIHGPTVDVKREFKIVRRPVSVCITEDIRTLAVLSSEMQVDVYDLEEKPPRRKQSLILDNSPQNIALSACGTTLAAAYEGGIEVLALNPQALSTEKRAVKCDTVDVLAFSRDGTQILGTTTVQSSPPSTVILTAPYYDPGSHVLEQSLSAMWTTSILFPNSSRDCSHAIWLPDGELGEAEWTFTYDRSFETFRAVRLDDLRNGTTYFTGPVPSLNSQTTLLPCTLPATTSRGDLVSAGFDNNDIWVYGVPEDLATVPETVADTHEPSSSSSGLARCNSMQGSLSRHASCRAHDGEVEERIPQWQILCDKVRNNLVAGSRVAELRGVSNVKWLTGSGGSSLRERLILTAPGVMGPRLVTDKEDIDFVDGGRIALLDFDYTCANGGTSEITIEVGTDTAEPLAEEQRDLEAEVAIVRRRTVAQRRGGGGSSALLRAATTAAAQSPLPVLPTENCENGQDPLLSRSSGHTAAARPSADSPESEPDEAFVSMEEQEAMDAPYAHSSPRSQTTLRRAATAAAVNRRLNPRTADGRPIQYRRADGRTEHPHESDADNWVPPPPPYQRDDPGDLPAFLRGPSVPPLSPTSFPRPPLLVTPTGASSSGNLPLSLAQVTSNPIQHRRAHHHQRTASDSTRISRLRTASSISRPRSTPSIQSTQRDEIYDVSPQASPRLPVALVAGPMGLEADSLFLSEASGRVSSPGAASSITTSSSSISYTDQSRTNSAALPLDPRSSVGTAARLTAPQLELRIPRTPSLLTSRSASSAHADMGGSSNAQNWSRRQQQHMPGESWTSAAALTQSAFPLDMPPSSNTFAADGGLSSTALPPAPSSSQLASLNKRISQGNPRRLSGNMLNSKLWTDDRSQVMAAGPSWSTRQSYVEPPPAARRWSEARVPDSDRPLIISTPTGITGSYDAPSSQRLSMTHQETPILAPVPRRPPQASPSTPGETAAQLQNIYGNQPAPAPLPPHLRNAPGAALPRWMRTPSTSSRRTPNNGISRRRSRAERSAAKNIKDAKLKTWVARRRNKAGTADSSWVDVSTPSQPKSKCLVM